MSRWTTTGLYVLLAALWGTSFVATRAALAAFPPILLAALRFDVAGVFVLGYALATTRRWRPRSREDWLSIALGGVLFVAAHHAFLFTGQQYVTAAVAAIVISLDPVLATGFSRVLLPDARLSRLASVGLLLGLLGVVVVANPTPSSLLSGDVLGIGLVFLAAAAFALAAVTTSRYRTTLPVQSMQAWMMLVGAVVLHATAVVLPGESFSAVHWTTDALLSFGYLAVVTGAFGYLLYFELLDRLGPVEINLVGYVIPIFAALGGWAVLGETVTVQTAAGFVVIVCGFVLVKHRAILDELRSAGVVRDESVTES